MKFKNYIIIILFIILIISYTLLSPTSSKFYYIENIKHIIYNDAPIVVHIFEFITPIAKALFTILSTSDAFNS